MLSLERISFPLVRCQMSWQTGFFPMRVFSIKGSQAPFHQASLGVGVGKPLSTKIQGITWAFLVRFPWGWLAWARLGLSTARSMINSFLCTKCICSRWLIFFPVCISFLLVVTSWIIFWGVTCYIISITSTVGMLNLHPAQTLSTVQECGHGTKRCLPSLTDADSLFLSLVRYTNHTMLLKPCTEM